MNQSKLPFVILGLLAQEPMSGYDLKKRMEVSVSNFIKASYGNIYPTLKRLEEEKLIQVFDESNIHKKRRYQVTEIGLNILKSWLTSIISEDEIFLLRVYFFSFISKKERLKLLEAYHQLLLSIQKRYVDIDETFGKVMGKYPYATLDYGKQMIHAEIKWLNQLKRKESV